MAPRIGLQLYTVKEEMAKDPVKGMERIAEIGYEGVEFAGYYGMTPDELKKLLARLGLTIAGTHIGIDKIKNNLAGEIEFARAIDCPAFICPHLATEYTAFKEEVLKTAELFNQIGKECKESGLSFLYHLHGTEFTEFKNGKRGIDVLIENCDPDLVNFEIDTYWVEYAGTNALDFYKQYSPRFPYIHFKDMNNHDEMFDVEIGEGVIQVEEIMNEAKNNTVEWFVVEQEKFKLPYFESIEISCQNLKQLREKIY